MNPFAMLLLAAASGSAGSPPAPRPPGSLGPWSPRRDLWSLTEDQERRLKAVTEQEDAESAKKVDAAEQKRARKAAKRLALENR